MKTHNLTPPHTTCSGLFFASPCSLVDRTLLHHTLMLCALLALDLAPPALLPLLPLLVQVLQGDTVTSGCRHCCWAAPSNLLAPSCSEPLPAATSDAAAPRVASPAAAAAAHPPLLQPPVLLLP